VTAESSSWRRGRLWKRTWTGRRLTCRLAGQAGLALRRQQGHLCHLSVCQHILQPNAVSTDWQPCDCNTMLETCFDVYAESS
jgi:hypothetical protein